MDPMPRITACCCPFAVFALLLGFGMACAARKPYQATLELQSLQIRENARESSEGVLIAIQPITRENIARFRDLIRMVSWREPNFNTEDPNAMGNPKNTLLRQGEFFLVPLPAFRMVIENRSKEELKLAGMQIQIQDDLSRGYNPILNHNQLRGRMITELMAFNRYAADNQDLVDSLTRELFKVTLLTPEVVVPTGGTWVGHLVLDLSAHNEEEYESMMRPVQQFVLQLKDVTTSSGSQPVKTNFPFKIEKSTRSILVSCPGAVTKPSLIACQPQSPRSSVK